MAFPRHDFRPEPPQTPAEELVELMLKSDLIAVIGLFEEVLVYFLSEYLFRKNATELGKEHLLGLNLENKIQLFNKMTTRMLPENRHDLKQVQENVIRRLKNAQLFRNVGAHGGKFQDLENGQFTWTGIKEPKQPRSMKEIEEIFGHAAYDLIDDVKWLYSEWEHIQKK